MPQGWQISGYGYGPGHEAYDIAPAEGVMDDRCYPLKDGVVVHAGRDTRPELAQHPEWDRGHYVLLRHGNGEESRYCHAFSLFVQVGQEVKGGATPLGLMGNSGFTQDGGRHWHIGFTKSGAGVDWLKEAGLG